MKKKAKKAPVKKSSLKKAAPSKPLKKKSIKKPAKKVVKPTLIKKLVTGVRPVRKTPAKNLKMRKIFFTGFPGFIGKRIVLKIFETAPDAEITFLVQPKFVKSAEDSIAEIRGIVGKESSMSVAVGDITEKDLGLDPAVSKKLKNEINEFWHLAAIYDLAIPQVVAHNVNVEGTKNVLDFCESLSELKRLVHFSTCYVSGERTGRILEDDLEMGQNFKNHYESTKFKSEVLVRERMSKIPAVIIRPAIVIGDSVTGAADKYDGPYPVIRLLAVLEMKKMILKGLRMPIMGKGSAPLNLVPIDYLVDASCLIAQKPGIEGKTFQICDPNPYTTKEFLTHIYKIFGLGAPIGSIPVAVVEALLNFPQVSGAMMLPKESLIYMDHNAIYDDTNTAEALAGTGLHCPDIREYLPRIVAYVRNNTRKKRAAMY